MLTTVPLPAASARGGRQGGGWLCGPCGACRAPGALPTAGAPAPPSAASPQPHCPPSPWAPPPRGAEPGVGALRWGPARLPFLLGPALRGADAGPSGAPDSPAVAVPVSLPGQLRSPRPEPQLAGAGDAGLSPCRPDPGVDRSPAASPTLGVPGARAPTWSVPNRPREAASAWLGSGSGSSGAPVGNEPPPRIWGHRVSAGSALPPHRSACAAWVSGRTRRPRGPSHVLPRGPWGVPATQQSAAAVRAGAGVGGGGCCPGGPCGSRPRRGAAGWTRRASEAKLPRG